jgi:hypothetical protein
MFNLRLSGKKVALLLGVALAALCCAAFGNPTERPYHEQLWEWLQQHNYKHWADGPDSDGGFRTAESPHGEYVKVYVNRAALNRSEDMPDGAVLVLENYSKRKKLISINVMQKSDGFDEKNGDWFYATYLPDGAVAKALSAKRGEIAFAGRVASCIECHAKAWDDDYAYFND